MAAKQGVFMYYSNRDAIGTKVSGRNRQGGRLSGVAVKRGSTVVFGSVTLCHPKINNNILELMFFSSAGNSLK